MAIVNEIRIEWDDVVGRESFNVYKSPDNVSYALLATGVTDTFYIDPVGTLDDWYKVACVDSFGAEGSMSDPIQGYDPADVCIIRGSVVNPDGSPSDGEPIEIAYYVDSGWVPGVKRRKGRFGDLPRFAQGNILTRKEVAAYTDYRGIFEVPVAKLALIMFTIKQTGYQCHVQVPDMDLIELEDLANYGEILPMEYPF